MVITTQQPVISCVLDCKKYSGLSRLLRVSTYVLRAVRQLKGEHTSDSDLTWILSPSELSGVERLWIADVQSTLTTNRKFHPGRSNSTSSLTQTVSGDVVVVYPTQTSHMRPSIPCFYQEITISPFLSSEMLMQESDMTVLEKL